MKRFVILFPFITSAAFWQLAHQVEARVMRKWDLHYDPQRWFN